MQQALLSIIRPKLNLAADFNQTAHLIEHLLLSPERLQNIGIDDTLFAQSLLLVNGYTSELYSAEYYLANKDRLPAVKERLLKQSNGLNISRDTFEREKAALTQELREKRGSTISQAEQFERAVYEDNQPAIRNPWFDDKGIKKLRLEEAEAIFQAHSQVSIIQELTFDTTSVTPHDPIATNQLKPGKNRITLTHPDQSPHVSDVYVMIPLTISNETYPQLMAYLAALGNYRFGALIQRLRHQLGLIYDITVYYHFYAQSMVIYFRCANEAVEQCLSEIEYVIHNPDVMHSTMRYAIEHGSATDEAAWGNISQHPLYYLEETLLGSLTTSPKERFAAMRQYSSDTIMLFGEHVSQHFSTNHVVVQLQCPRNCSASCPLLVY